MAYSEFSDDFEEESRAEPIKIIGERDPEAQAAVDSEASSSSSSQFFCPLTREPIRLAVVCSVDGQTYERSAITAHIQSHGTSPLSGEPVEPRHLLPAKKIFAQAAKCEEDAADAADAAELVVKLIKGGTPELSAVPKYLLELRRVAQSSALKIQTQTVDEGKPTKPCQHNGQSSGVLADTTNIHPLPGTNSEGVKGSSLVKEDGVYQALTLARAVNGLEIELVTAQRQRRRQDAEKRIAARDKRRRAEARRAEYDSTLVKAQEQARSSALRLEDVERRLVIAEAAAASATEASRVSREASLKAQSSAEAHLKALDKTTAAAAESRDDARRRLSSSEAALRAVKRTLEDALAAKTKEMTTAKDRWRVERELLNKTRESMEARWSRRWEALPEHQRLRLKEEKTRLNDERDYVMRRAVAVEEEAKANKAAAKDTVLRFRSDMERQRAEFAAHMEAERADARQSLAETKARLQQEELRQQALRIRLTDENTQLELKRQSLEKDFSDLAVRQSQAALDRELLLPRLKDLEARSISSQEKERALAEKEKALNAQVEKLNSKADAQKAVGVAAESEALRLKTLARRLHERERTVAQENSVMTQKKRRHLLDEERLEVTQGTLLHTALQIRKAAHIARRFQDMVVLKAKRLNLDHTKSDGYIAINANRQLESVIQGAAEALALENELNELLSSMDASLRIIQYPDKQTTNMNHLNSTALNQTLTTQRHTPPTQTVNQISSDFFDGYDFMDRNIVHEVSDHLHSDQFEEPGTRIFDTPPKPLTPPPPPDFSYPPALEHESLHSEGEMVMTATDRAMSRLRDHLSQPVIQITGKVKLGDLRTGSRDSLERLRHAALLSGAIH